jgi:predicted RNA-binding protein with RPS1 domain
MGRITTLTSFGAFVAVDSGVEGLIHVKDIREGKLNHPGDVLTEGQYIRVQVLECDPIHHKLRLGLKQLAEKPLAISAKSHAPVVGENSNVQVADYMQYSRSVFVNCPTHEPHRAVTEAIVFAILEAAFIPRLAADRDTVVSAVRECQFGIHDVSRTFEMGLFFGCQQYGADLHRMKTALLFHSETRDAVLGEDVYAHLNRPSEALHHVTNWLAKILRTTARPEQVWNHYQQFRTDTERSFLKANTSSQDPALATYIQAVSKWLE